jgi:hypothetical protein
VRSQPADLAADELSTVLAEGWGLHVASLEYVPAGGGSYHWRVTGADGRPHFVTADDLDGKDWLGSTRGAVFSGLKRALSTAFVLRHDVGLDFVVAPATGRDGEVLCRLGGRYAVSVFPFLAGRSYPFGPYPDARLRGMALDMMAALHQSTSAVRELAPGHVPSFGGLAELDAFLLDPDRLGHRRPRPAGARCSPDRRTWRCRRRPLPGGGRP